MLNAMSTGGRSVVGLALAVWVTAFAAEPTPQSAVGYPTTQPSYWRSGPNPTGLAAGSSFPKLTEFSVDLSSRQQIRAFYNSVFSASEETPVEFTGDVGACSAGTTAALYKDAVQLRVNWFRELAGIPDVITFTTTFNASAQEAALMMAANRSLSHSPPSSWDCFTQTGADAAANSNLALGNAGWDAISGYMIDNGANNTAVGHRRWILFPPIETMGTGDVPETEGFLAANGLWVFDDMNGSSTTRDGYVAWPPKGFVPYGIVPPRWSFGLDGADFSSASVTMMSGGSSVDLALEPISSGSGLNSLVWVPLGLDPDESSAAWPKPDADTTYEVSLSGVMVDGESQSYQYEVTVFDPGVALESEVIPEVSGDASVETDSTGRYAFVEVPFAEAYNLRSGDLTAFTGIEGAETGLDDITDGTDDDYELVSTGVAASGSGSFHLAHPNAVSQSFTWTKKFLVSSTSELVFQSRLGWAGDDQIAKAQISTDDGQTWIEVYSQAGTGDSGESSFTEQRISLASYDNTVVQTRFYYEFETGTFFSQTDNGIGFYVDDITVTNAEEVTDTVVTALGGATGFSFTPETTGSHLLQVQYEGWEGFAGSAWSPAFKVTGVAASAAESTIFAAVLPGSRSMFEATAGVFASIINAGSATATGCRIVPKDNVAANFLYQTTDPGTNALTGSPNTPLEIAAGATGTFAIFFTPAGTFDPIDLNLSFDCDNTAPAPIVSGLNTLLLSSSSSAVADIIAIVAAAGGIVDIPGDTGTGVFAVATVNVGTSDTITASATAGQGVNVLVCQTVPESGACMADPASSVTATIANEETPTFGFFVVGNGNVPFDPANNRVTVQFKDGNEVVRGATSVAMRTI